MWDKLNNSPLTTCYSKVLDNLPLTTCYSEVLEPHDIVTF